MQFDAAITDKASVERALMVTTTPPVEGSWAWLPDEAGGSRVHWRTRDYYPAGTKVHVAAKLYGVPFGDGAFGAQDLTLDFEIGRRQVVKAEASSHQIEVITDEGVIMDFPCSYGEADLPRNITRSGVHVVTEKYEDFYMSNPAAGYSNVHERYAVRISNNGEFIHSNPNSTGAQGNTNVTNGCINLSTWKTPSSTSTPRSTATPSRSPARRSNCPTPTATSGTGPSTGTSGSRCRRSPHRPRPSTSRAPRP